MKISIVPAGQLMTCCYIIYDEINNTGIIIDPGAEEKKIAKKIESLKITVKSIFITHGHYDHVGAVKYLADLYNADVYMNFKDLDLYNSQQYLINQLSASGIYDSFKDYDENKIYKITDNLSFKVLYTPGHSKGGVCLEALNYNTGFCGDTVFKETIGRTDLPGGDYGEIMQSIKKIIDDYPDNYKLYPGHGLDTSIAAEKKYNPYFKEIL